MSYIRVFPGIAVLAAGMFFSVMAQAHPRLVSSTPEAGSMIAAPEKITLNFNEKLIGQFSEINLLMTGMPGEESTSSKSVEVTTAVRADTKTLIATPGQPLTAGNYRVEWRVVSSDTHPVTGDFAFTIAQ